MKRALALLLVSVLTPLAGCDKKPAGGLPPATDWQAPAPSGATGPGPTGPSAGRAGVGDPHAGVAGAPALGGGGAIDPHAGVPGAPPIGGGGGGDPHAGVPGAPPIGGGGDPHAGVPGAPPIGGGGAHGGGGGGVDVGALGLPSPDPNRPVDASKFIAGTIDVPSAMRAQIPQGAAIFVSVRTLDPASGEGRGAPIAVDKLVASGTWPMTFKLTEAQAMIGGTGFNGDVVVSVRFDQDSDAMSKQPGDITGKAKTSIPSSGVKITLDTTL